MKYKKGTFVIVPNLDELKGKPSEMQAIYLWICQHTDFNGLCFPKKATIGREAGCSHNTVDKYLKKLVEDGFLEITPRKNKEGKNTSNEYQLLIMGGTPTQNWDDSQPNIGSQTISNITNSNITIDIQPKVVVEEGITLPKMKLDGSSSGKDAVNRLLYLYGKLYYQTYEVTYKPNYKRDIPILKGVLEMYSEVQTAYLLCVYFNWHGMTGSDSKEYNFVTGATFPIPMFKTMINKFEVYARNIMSAPFDDDSKLLDEVIKIVSN